MERIYLSKPISSIPVKGSLVKEKVIFHNGEKILVFEDVQGKENKVFIPSFSNLDNQALWNEFLSEYINLLYSEPILESIRYDIRMETVNTSLKKYYLSTIRRYFSCYIDFSPEKVKQIEDLAFKCSIYPYLLSFDDVRNLKAWNMINLF